jgi:small subunit ribosomal protein S4
LGARIKMKKQNKKYSRPRKPFDKARIDEENVLKEEYGLKNKKEIWKAEAAIGRIRNLAKRLITKPEEEKNSFVKRLQKKGFNVNSIADALALKKEDWLKRRLQTIVFSKKLTNTPKQARQFVSHKHVSIGEQTINIPSYQVSLEQEPLVRLNIVLKTPKPISKIEKIKEKVLESKTDKPKEIEEVDEENNEFIEKIKEIEETGDIV